MVPRIYDGKLCRFKRAGIACRDDKSPGGGNSGNISVVRVGNRLPAARAVTASSAEQRAAPMSNGNTRSPNSSSTPSSISVRAFLRRPSGSAPMPNSSSLSPNRGNSLTLCFRNPSRKTATHFFWNCSRRLAPISYDGQARSRPVRRAGARKRRPVRCCRQLRSCVRQEAAHRQSGLSSPDLALHPDREWRR